jgi:hypothetical protein
MLERIRRCRFCGREMKVSGMAYAENPFCLECLPDRLKASGARPHKTVGAGDYVALVPCEEGDQDLLSSDSLPTLGGVTRPAGIALDGTTLEGA